MELKDRIRNTRKDKGLTQGDVADALNISAAAVGSWESGRAKPRIDKLNELASLLGVSPHWLLDGSDTSGTSGLSALEWELIMCFRSTDERGRETILSVARSQRGATGQVQGSLRKGA